MILSFLKRTGIIGGGVAFCFLLSALIVPSILDFTEMVFHTPLSYEGALRFYIAFAWALFLLAWLWWLLRKGDYRTWILFLIVLASYAMTLVVFIGDRNHALMEEFSWIRYTTTVFLMLAALCAGALAYVQWKSRTRAVAAMWGLFVGGLFYAGLDEVLQIHEYIGTVIEKATGLSHAVTDYVTLSYAIITVIVVLVSLRPFLTAYRDRHAQSLYLFCLGAVAYLFSTLFDTFDGIVVQRITTLAKTLSAPPSFIFSDVWYIVWSPKTFLNGLEEVFEQTAAMIFFSALLLILIDRHMFHCSTKRLSRGIQLFKHSLGAFLICIGVTSAVVIAGEMRLASPLRDGRTAAVIAGPLDGLRHTDDLFFHPVWGVIIANEGKGDVYRWQGDLLMHVPDTEKKVSDTDSITATDDAILAASGAKGTVFEYTKKDGWREKWGRAEGLVHPEALIVGVDDAYILDESQRTITRISKDTGTIVWKPEHPEWKAPEGVVYDAKSETLFVTDDETGAVFEVVFGASVRPVAHLAAPEDIVQLPDGSLLVSDNAWGAVFHVKKDGAAQKIVQFRRAYRDLQGITIDEQGRIYVVTADGHDSTSFMPSFVFRIDSL